jgi:outer membrane protein TolC
VRLRAIPILAIAALSASAQISESRVDLRELTGEAIKNNPDIVAAQKKYEAARQRPTEESSLPDPMVSLGTAVWAIPCLAPASGARYWRTWE